MNIFLKHFWLNISWRHNVCSCGVNCWGGAEETVHQCVTMMTYYTYTHFLTITMNVFGIFVVCLIVWLLLPVWHYDDVLHIRTSLHHYIWMSVFHRCFFYYMTTFPEKLTTSGTMMTTHIYIFCLSMCMTLGFFVCLWYVCLCDFFCQEKWPQPPYYILPWWRVARTHKLCWFRCPCVTLWLLKYWKFQFEI